ncbi:MAG: DUF4242 domain-containing protein [Sideroxydans sp.]|nr:DUF4242 domain-containing protein [Sideroxydans sp.]
MQAMRFFIDTHDRNNSTFPEQIAMEDFEKFYALYEQACYAENVVPIRIHLSYEAGRAFCLNMATDAEAVRRAHERVGLPFDTITEITTATPGDTFFRRAAA